jgi:hypothetical protein
MLPSPGKRGQRFVNVLSRRLGRADGAVGAHETRVWTFDDLYPLPDDGNKYELIRGDLMRDLVERARRAPSSGSLPLSLFRGL